MSTPFKLKSSNKPSIAQLSGISPMKEIVDKGASKGKVNPFSAEYKRMTKSQRRKKYNTKDKVGNFDKEKDTFKKIGSGKTGKIGNIDKTLKDIVKSVTGGNSSKSYTKMKSVNALVSDRKKWQTKNPNKKYPGQAEINKRLKKNPNKWD